MCIAAAQPSLSVLLVSSLLFSYSVSIFSLLSFFFLFLLFSSKHPSELNLQAFLSSTGISQTYAPLCDERLVSQRKKGRKGKMAGAQCCSNPPTLNPVSGAGHVEELGGLSTYVSGFSNSKRAILLVSDVFGYDAPNLRKLADKIAAAGFYVVVPDFLYGDPYIPENGSIQNWIKNHGVDKAFEDAKPVIEAVKSKGISAVGAAGFCWGAKVVVLLAKSELAQAAVLLHPSFVTINDIKEVKVPIAVLGAEIDRTSPPELLKQFEEVLATKSEIDSYVKIFPKVSHGWTVRYNVEDEAAVKSAEEAHGNMLEWFAKHIPGRNLL